LATPDLILPVIPKSAVPVHMMPLPPFHSMIEFSITQPEASEAMAETDTPPSLFWRMELFAIRTLTFWLSAETVIPVTAEETEAYRSSQLSAQLIKRIPAQSPFDGL